MRGRTDPSATRTGISTPIVYDSVNRRLVGQREDELLAFDPTTRAWTVLLEAIEGQPAAG